MCRSRYRPAISANVGSGGTTAGARERARPRARVTRVWDRRDEPRTCDTTGDITPPRNAAASCRVHVDALVAPEVQSNVSGMWLRGPAGKNVENVPNSRAVRWIGYRPPLRRTRKCAEYGLNSRLRAPQAWPRYNRLSITDRRVEVGKI